MLTLNWNIIWTFVDLIVLYVLMKKFLFARVQKVLDQRQEMIQGQMDHAKEQEALANQNLQQAQETVENATKEAREKAQRIFAERRKHSTLLVIAHSTSVIRKNCDNAAILKDGRLHFFNTLNDALTAYKGVCDGTV